MRTNFPPAIQHFMTASTLGIEILIPFLIFFPRRLRMFGAWCLIGMQVVILFTGNYAFFNLLTIALTLFLFDDQALARFVPAAITEKTGGSPRGHRRTRESPPSVALLVMVLSLSHLVETFHGRLPSYLNAVVRYTAPLQIVNTYGLFAVMTTQRIEIILEGSAGRRDMEALRVQVQARRRQPRSRLGGPLPAAPRLADVVRSPQ